MASRPRNPTAADRKSDGCLRQTSTQLGRAAMSSVLTSPGASPCEGDHEAGARDARRVESSLPEGSVSAGRPGRRTEGYLGCRGERAVGQSGLAALRETRTRSPAAPRRGALLLQRLASFSNCASCSHGGQDAGGRPHLRVVHGGEAGQEKVAH